MFEMFTTRARKAILEAEAESAERGDSYIGTEHILIGLLREGTGLAAVVLGERSVTLEAVRTKFEELAGPPPDTVAPRDALASIGIDLDQVRARLEESFGPGALIDPSSRPPFTPKAKAALERAVTEASGLRHRYVGTEHELLGVISDRDGLAAKLLGELGADLDVLADDVRNRAAPDETRLQRLLAERRAVDRKIVDVAEDRRDAARGVLEELGEAIQAALHEEYQEGLASTRRLAASVEESLASAHSRLDELAE